MAMKKRRLQLFFIEHGTTIGIGVGIVVLAGLATWGMMSLESYYRKMTLAQLPLGILNAILYAFLFVWMQMNMLGRGFGAKNKAVKADHVNIRFDDVVGIDEAKDECREVVDLIKDHTRIKNIGGKILRGVLMIGPPGCGKTYIAKAIATETGLPFLSMAASEFNEVFVGVGASRVRGLFKKARRLAYGYGGCVIFIDELDAMGHKRTFSQFGSGEGNTTQNQLLVELDGLGSGPTENIVVIGATNASEDILDPALLRPGRFDRKVYISKPNLEGREAVFNLYLKKIKHDASVDPKRLARRTIGYTPAEIENAVKESALVATRNKRDIVTWGDMTEALDRIELGFKIKLSINSKEREMTAYHETGHLITTFLLHPRDDVFKASILPRKNTLGVVYHVPTEEWHSQDKETLTAQIKIALGGYAGERVKYGTSTSGVSSDFKSAMGIAHTMVWRLGMGPSGLVGDFTIVPEGQLSKEMVTQLSQDTQKVITDCLNEVEALLRKEKLLFERFAQELISKGELQYDEIESIFAEFGKTNPRKFGTAHSSDSKYLPPSAR